MLFSVIIPTHHRTRGITHALSSLLLQTHPHWEAIIVDQSSSGAMSQLRPLLSQDRRIRYTTKEYRYPSEAYAWGISAARGDVITFIEPDHYFAPNHLHAQYEFLTSHPGIDVIIGKPTIIGSPYIKESENSDTFIHINHALPPGTFFIREHVFDTVHELPHYFHHGADLYTQLKDHKFKTHILPMPTYIYDRSLE